MFILAEAFYDLIDWDSLAIEMKDRGYENNIKVIIPQKVYSFLEEFFNEFVEEESIFVWLVVITDLIQSVANMLEYSFYYHHLIIGMVFGLRE